jgi:tetratricopeptide (TPR) repeat protein
LKSAKPGSVSWSILRRAVNLSRQGKHPEALAQANLLPKDSGQDERWLYQTALIQLEAEQPAEALATLDRVTSGTSPVFHLYRAIILGQLERWDEALVESDKLMAASPGHQFLPSLQCYLLLGSGRIEEALKPLQVGKPMGWISWFRPELAGFSPLLSRLLLQVEAYLLPLEFPELQAGKALEEPVTIETPKQKLNLTTVINSMNGYVQQRRGLRYWEKGLTTSDHLKRDAYLELNLKAQREAVALEPLQFRGYYHLGEALLYASTPRGEQQPKREYLEEAETCFIHSWAQEGANPYLNFYLGRTLQMLGQPLAAKEYLERALKQFEKFPEAHYALGQLHLLMGEPAQAREWLKKSVSSDFLPVARERLHDLLEALNQGKLGQKPAMPKWPPPPAAGSDPTNGHPPPVESAAVASAETAESHQCADLASLPESHETSPVPPEEIVADSPSTPPAPVAD